MENLIKALKIFLKYSNSEYPTHCEHDELSIADIEKEQVCDDDIKELDKLGFFWSDEDECFKSFHFGSA